MRLFKWNKSKKSTSFEFAKLMSESFSKNEFSFSDYEKVYFEVLVTVKHVLNITPHVKQIEASHLMVNGKSVDMPTGEGKTIALGVAAAVLALTTKNKVVVCSSNDVLSSRDLEYLSPFFVALGLTHSGINSRDDLTSQIIYSSYSTLAGSILELEKNTALLNTLLGKKETVLLVDEIDTVVIDQGIRPVSVSDKKTVSITDFELISKIEKTLTIDDFDVDPGNKNIFFSEDAVQKIISQHGIDIYALDQSNILHSLSVLVKANRVMKVGVDYLFEDDKILVIDPVTGFIQAGSEFVGGLQQALQFKEGASFTDETFVNGTITTQRLFNTFKRVCGCSGTAKLAEEEILVATGSEVVEVERFFSLNVVDGGSRIFTDKSSMFDRAFSEVSFLKSKNNSPLLLIFENSKEAMDFYSGFLEKSDFTVDLALGDNIKADQKIFIDAGKSNKLTVATVAAGRGVDIVMGEDVNEGMNLITVGAFSSVRSSAQAKGRVGRHGDQGSFQEFCSLSDSLVEEFGGSSLQKIKGFVDKEPETELTGKMFKNLFSSAQKESDLSIREALVGIYQYDELIGTQREAFLSTRNAVLSDSEFNLNWLKNMVGKYSEALVLNSDLYGVDTMTDGEIASELNKFVGISIFDESLDSNYGINSLVLQEIETISQFKDLSAPVTQTAIFVLDSLWGNHFRDLSNMKEGIHLRALNAKDPFSEFKRESYNLYSGFSGKVALNLVDNVLGVSFSLLLKMSKTANKS